MKYAKTAVSAKLLEIKGINKYILRFFNHDPS